MLLCCCCPQSCLPHPQGSWNDADMLQLCTFGEGATRHWNSSGRPDDRHGQGLTMVEYVSHLSVWAVSCTRCLSEPCLSQHHRCRCVLVPISGVKMPRPLQYFKALPPGFCSLPFKAPTRAFDTYGTAHDGARYSTNIGRCGILLLDHGIAADSQRRPPNGRIAASGVPRSDAERRAARREPRSGWQVPQAALCRNQRDRQDVRRGQQHPDHRPGSCRMRWPECLPKTGASAGARARPRYAQGRMRRNWQTGWY